MMRKILLMCYCVALAWSASAQQRNVTGKVTDATDGTGLPGVSVVVKGTTIGTVSDTNGDFSISVNSNDVLSFSFIGFEPQEITVGERTSITLSMTASINELDEVIVIGYGEREKKDITGSISSMGAKDIEKSAYINPEQAMQGKMAGVFVSSPSGAPNARPNVLIRGIGTFNEGTQPLYVIDGVPTFEFGQATEEGLEGDVRGTVNILTLINPGDIESISVLKDAAASAIYGARAANGVVLITTKKGKSGAPKIDFNASAGVQQLSKTYDVLNTQDFVKLYTDMFDADTEYRRQYAPSPNPAAPYSWDVPGQQYLNVFNPNSTDPYYKYLGNSPTYDWQNELQNKNASIQDYSVRISGGNDATTYYIGGGFSKTESPLINNSLKRYSLSTNIQTKISKAIEVGLLYRLSYVNAIDNTSGAIDGASRVSPWQPIYDTNDPTGFARTTDVAFIPNPAFDLTKANSGAAQIQVPGSSQMRPWGNESNFNYFANMALTKRDYALLKNFGNVYLQIQPLKGLKIIARKKIIKTN